MAKTTHLKLNDQVTFSFIVTDGNRGRYRDKLQELGVVFSESAVSYRVVEFTILPATLNSVFIGMLNDLFNSTTT